MKTTGTHCEDCGTKMHKDICPNCSEELYIFEVQAIEQTMSDEFMEKVVEQRRMLQKRLTK